MSQVATQGYSSQILQLVRVLKSCLQLLKVLELNQSNLEILKSLLAAFKILVSHYTTHEGPRVNSSVWVLDSRLATLRVLMPCLTTFVSRGHRYQLFGF